MFRRVLRRLLFFGLGFLVAREIWLQYLRLLCKATAGYLPPVHPEYDDQLIMEDGIRKIESQMTQVANTIYESVYPGSSSSYYSPTELAHRDFSTEVARFENLRQEVLCAYWAGGKLGMWEDEPIWVHRDFDETTDVVIEQLELGEVQLPLRGLPRWVSYVS